MTAPRWRSLASANGRRVELRVQVEPGLQLVGSRAGLREALTNLVFNALDAMPEGGSIVLAALAAGMLRRDGHQATETSSGQEALERLRAERFDLMITDLSMGEGMNGWELASATDRLVPGLPIVLATGWGAAIDEQEARNRGVQAVLAKPFRLADLREVVARVIPA